MSTAFLQRSLLNAGIAAVDHVVCADDEGRPGAGQEYDHVCNFLRLREAANRVLHGICGRLSVLCRDLCPDRGTNFLIPARNPVHGLLRSRDFVL